LDSEVPELPGVICYGETANEALSKAEFLTLRIMAERLGCSNASCGAWSGVVTQAFVAHMGDLGGFFRQQQLFQE
jgi:hypothetical protein